MRYDYLTAVQSQRRRLFPAVIGGSPGGGALLAGETDGFATDFTYSDDNYRVAVKTSGVPVYSALDAFFSNGGTSPKMVFDVTGALVWSPHNILAQAEDFTTTWLATNITATANQTAAADGTLTADKALETVTNGDHILYQTSITLVTGATYTQSIDLKYLGRQWIRIYNGNTFIFFDILNGVVGTNGSSLANTITAVGNGFYRITVTFVAASTGGTQINTVLSDGAGTTYAGDVTKGFYVSRAQLNRGTIPTAYLPTTSAARFGLAVDYDPVTHAAKGLLVEPAATNLCLASTDLSNGAWSTSAASVSVDQVASPNGSVSADKLIENTSNAIHALNQSIAVTSAATMVVSFYVKAAGRTALRVKCAGGFTADPIVEFDLSAVTSATQQGNPSPTHSIQSVGNGWYRCSMSSVPNASTTTTLQIFPCSAPGTQFYTGDGASGLFLWGIQFELGSVATSPIPTFASTVTRAADLPNFLLSTIPALGSAYSSMMEMSSAQITSAVYQFSICDAGSNNTATLGTAQGSINNAGQVVRSASSTVVNSDAGVITANTSFKSAGRFVVNDFAVSLNGAAPVADTVGAMPIAPTAVYLGGPGTAVVSVAYFKKLIIVPRAWANAELQSRST